MTKKQKILLALLGLLLIFLAGIGLVLFANFINSDSFVSLMSRNSIPSQTNEEFRTGNILGQPSDDVRRLLESKGYKFQWSVELGEWEYRPNPTTIFSLREDSQGNINGVTVATDIPMSDWINGLLAADDFYKACGLPLPHEEGLLEFFDDYDDTFMSYDKSERRMVIYPLPNLEFEVTNYDIFIATYSERN